MKFLIKLVVVCAVIIILLVAGIDVAAAPKAEDAYHKTIGQAGPHKTIGATSAKPVYQPKEVEILWGDGSRSYCQEGNPNGLLLPDDMSAMPFDCAHTYDLSSGEVVLINGVLMDCEGAITPMNPSQCFQQVVANEVAIYWVGGDRSYCQEGNPNGLHVPDNMSALPFGCAREYELGGGDVVVINGYVAVCDGNTITPLDPANCHSNK